MVAIKRSVLLGLISFLFALCVFPQKSEPPTREANLYAKALFASLAEMDKSWGQIDDSDGGSRIRSNYHQMLVEKDPDITDGLPLQLGNFGAEYLDQQAQIARYKKLRKEFSILKIHPIQIEGSRLTITISVYYLAYRKGKLNLGVSDWSEVEFRYDCDKQNYVVASVKLGGI